MQLPRFLWVPFELGRPFGAPGEPDFQRRVLRSALSLLERDDGPVILEDFPDDAPEAEETAGDQGWACPVSFHPPTLGKADLVEETLAEIERLSPWHEILVVRRGPGPPFASGLTPAQIVRGLGVLSRGERVTAVPTELPLQQWVRLGCDDLRNWYLEAAQGRPGRPKSSELRDWFWRDTALAKLIAGAAEHIARSGSGGDRAFARRAMVPRAYMRELMPDVEPLS